MRFWYIHTVYLPNQAEGFLRQLNAEKKKYSTVTGILGSVLTAITNDFVTFEWRV